LSEAVAETVVELLMDAPLEGAVIEMVGGVLSDDSLSIKVKVWALGDPML
jgi:hypothetical protein